MVKGPTELQSTARTSPWNDLGSKIAVGVGTALVLGVLGLAWNTLSKGQLVVWLGGVTQTDVSSQIEAAIARLPAPKDGAPGRDGAEVLKSSVVAFDSEGCPAGWTSFEPAESRAIIGATVGPSPNVDVNGAALSPRAFRLTGGEEAHTLTAAELPPHVHNITLGARWGEHAASGVAGWSMSDAEGVASMTVKTDLSDAPTKAHNTMPPFVALFYCKLAM